MTSYTFTKAGFTRGDIVEAMPTSWKLSMGSFISLATSLQNMFSSVSSAVTAVRRDDVTAVRRVDVPFTRDDLVWSHATASAHRTRPYHACNPSY